MYILDGVLLSLVPNVTDNDVESEGLPNLMEHLQQWRYRDDSLTITSPHLTLLNLYRIANFSVKTFADRVQSLGGEKFPEFSQIGKFTFFLPVDSAFQVRERRVS